MGKTLRVSVALVSVFAATVVVAPPAAAAPMCFGKRATIVGSNDHGIERIVGTPGPDVIVGRNGSDVIKGRGGNDRICGGGSTDRIKGNGGRDRISSGSESCSEERYYEVIEGNKGRDRMAGGDCLEKIYGGQGADVITDSNGVLDAAELFGGAGDDSITFGTAGRENSSAAFIPGPGDDVLRDRTARGGIVIYSSSDGGVEVDLETGRATGEGTDLLENFHSVVGSPHSDVLRGTAEVNAISGLAGNDSLEGAEGNDSLGGGGGDDTIIAGPGDDYPSGGEGDDTISGGEGIDTIDYYGHDSPVHVDLSTGEATGEGSDVLSEIENVTGGRKDDVLIGDDGPNVLQDCCRAKSADTMRGGGANDTIYSDWGPDVVDGGAGDDTIFGDHGADRLDGGEGVDNVDGGNGNDTCSAEVMTNCEAV